MAHDIFHKVVAKQQNIGLRGNVLRQTEEDTSGLGQPCCVEEDAIAELIWEGSSLVVGVDLFDGREGIGEVRHCYFVLRGWGVRIDGCVLRRKKLNDVFGSLVREAAKCSLALAHTGYGWWVTEDGEV